MGNRGAASWRPRPGESPRSERNSWFPRPAAEPQAPEPRASGNRVAWAELCRHPDFAGRWVALAAVRYEDGLPLDGELVDADEDLAALCNRVQSADDTSCAILYCDASGARSRRPPAS